MDNMLYIIAGLVIILVIGVWILRKNKAQRPTSQPMSGSALPSASAAPVQREADNNMNSATLFDDITVAQRFIDQQRYDKAIETLERGLNDKPNDSALSLKLLNVYALSNDTEAFYTTFAAITAYGDRLTIAQAQQLKELLEEDRGTQAPRTMSSSAQLNMMTEHGGITTEPNLVLPVQASPNNPHHEMALDFDFSPSTSAANRNLAENSEVNQDIERPDSPINSTFNLTLDDLEATDDAINIEPAPLLDTQNGTDTLAKSLTQLPKMDAKVAQDHLDDLNTGDKVDNLVLDVEAVDPTKNSDQVAPIIDSSVNNGVDAQSANEFELDFDAFLDEVVDIKREAEPAALRANDVEETSDDNDYTILDFDESSTLELKKEPMLNPSASNPAEYRIESSHNDFQLSSHTTTEENKPINADIEKSVANTQNTNPVLTDDLELIDFDFDFDVAFDTQSDIEEQDTQTTTSPTTTSASDSTLTFDDDTDIDMLDFNIDFNEQSTEPVTTAESMIPASSPVLINEDHDTEKDAQFAAQFAEDFAFVDTLDSQQITLDLAKQYLQLGEYDSAKRLFHEVVAQGNPEQKAQAQALLARTA